MPEIGRARRRVEDERLVRGAGRYVDDLEPAGLLHAAFARCPYAHARLMAIDTTAARAAWGVVAVLTAADLPSGAKGDPGQSGFLAAPSPVLIGEVAHHVGFPLAIVVAQSEAQALDAVALVEAEWAPLDAVATIEAALALDAPLAHSELGTNVAFVTRRGTSDAEIDAVLRVAAHVTRCRLHIPRVAAVPMQPMTLLVEPEPVGDGLTIWGTTQTPVRLQTVIASALGLPEARVRAVAPDVGGGFGVRSPVYPEYHAVAHAAWRLRRPVRWRATRSEDMLSTRAARETLADAEIAADANGRLLAIRARVTINLGAYADAPGAGGRILQCLSGAYAVDAVAVELRGVYTNTTPTGAYRGAGRPEAAYIVERMVDALAAETGIDPAELRRRNFVARDRFPYRTPLGSTYDSGDYRRAFDRALEAIGYEEARERQVEARRNGDRRLLGIGMAAYVEPTAAGWESGHVRVEPSGRVTAHSGSSAQGQGHQTTFAQIVADRLGVPFERVTILQGDTAAGPPGTGTFGSRSTTLGGGALDEAAGRVVERARDIAAHLLEAALADVVSVEDGFAIAGAAARRVGWPDVSRAAWSGNVPAGTEPGLEATCYFKLSADPYSFGACAVLISLDSETGEVEIERLVAVDDCGTVVNPLLLAGQTHGGLAQGVGASLIEWMRYDADGQPLSATLMDYAVPLARDLPTFEVEQQETPSPLNRLGVKGHAEAGTIAAPPAVIGAVLDALAPFGIREIDPPLLPERVWAALRHALYNESNPNRARGSRSQ